MNSRASSGHRVGRDIATFELLLTIPCKAYHRSFSAELVEDFHGIDLAGVSCDVAMLLAEAAMP